MLPVSRRLTRNVFSRWLTLTRHASVSHILNFILLSSATEQIQSFYYVTLVVNLRSSLLIWVVLIYVLQSDPGRACHGVDGCLVYSGSVSWVVGLDTYLGQMG